MSEGRCKNCRWWEQRGYPWHQGWGFCSLADEGGEYQGAMMVILCYEEGELATAPEFGCVQFAAKGDQR